MRVDFPTTVASFEPADVAYSLLRELMVSFCRKTYGSIVSFWNSYDQVVR